MKNRKNNITAKAILASAAMAGLLGGSAARLQAGQTDSRSTTTMAGQLGDLTDSSQSNYNMRTYHSCSGSGGKMGAGTEGQTSTLIKSVDTSANSIAINDGKSTHNYTIDGATTVTVNGNPGTLNDIKAGMKVLSMTERDSSTLDSISVGPAGPSKEKSKKNK